MNISFQARWISKQRLDAIRRSREVARGVLLDSFNGFLIVEPVGSDLGDGSILSREDADYELNPVWCSGPKGRLREARRLLGLAALQAPRTLAEVG
jgi:hypothetical protein